MTLLFFIRQGLSATDPDFDNRFEANAMRVCAAMGLSGQDYHDLSIESSKYFTPAGQCFTGRRFCVTRNGYMGWVSPGTEIGDFVCVFIGGRTPCILRQASTGRQPFKTGKDSRAEESSTFSYILVGECYMHGMMDGEMMNLGKSVEEFIISWIMSYPHATSVKEILQLVS